MITQVGRGVANLAGKSVLYVPPAGADSAAEQAVLKQLYAASADVVLLHATDSAGFAARLHRGNGPLLKEQYVVLSTHLDTASGADNRAGVAALFAVALGQ